MYSRCGLGSEQWPGNRPSTGDFKVFLHHQESCDGIEFSRWNAHAKGEQSPPILGGPELPEPRSGAQGGAPFVDCLNRGKRLQAFRPSLGSGAISDHDQMHRSLSVPCFQGRKHGVAAQRVRELRPGQLRRLYTKRIGDDMRKLERFLRPFQVGVLSAKKLAFLKAFLLSKSSLF